MHSKPPKILYLVKYLNIKIDEINYIQEKLYIIEILISRNTNKTVFF